MAEPVCWFRVKLQQEISGCWRTLAGAEAFLTVRSHLSTACKQGLKQGLNPLDVLRTVGGQPLAPSPSPSPSPSRQLGSYHRRWQ